MIFKLLFSFHYENQIKFQNFYNQFNMLLYLEGQVQYSDLEWSKIIHFQSFNFIYMCHLILTKIII